ncbi:MAG: hypothetical protein HZA89_17995 [Verrucomicrobia bacterium]|nr:hypothetical protein [Verrucomicrobiota bacterium]
MSTASFWFGFFAFALGGLASAFGADLPDGNAVIRSRAGVSDIVITTTARLAGAVHSVTWNGKEFIDSHDHGRQLQSASNGDAGSPIKAETFNPTEAGSRRDGAGPKSSSRLLHLVAKDNVLQTTSQMAFWLAPGEKSEGNPAKNITILSDHLLTKRVQIGWRGMHHVIAYDVTFGLPVGERHNHFVFEALTGYMPSEFSRFWGFNAKTGELESITGPAREQKLPLVFATESGSHAMGIFSPEPNPSYGQFRFPHERVVKWNCVFRRTDNDGVKPGDYSFRQFVIVGDLTAVRDSMRALHREFAGREQP